MLAEVVRTAEEHEIVVNRVSQGSGAMLLAESELREMAAIGAEAGLEVSLFTGPREGWDIGRTRARPTAPHMPVRCAACAGWPTPSRTSRAPARPASAAS